MPDLRWLTAPWRLLVGVAVATPFLFWLPSTDALWLRLLMAWDVFGLVYLGLSWLAILQMTPEKARSSAEAVDAPHQMALILVLIAAITSFFSAAVMLHRGDSLQAHGSLLGLATVVLAWFLTHTTFGMHYMHLFYGSGHTASGLDFPGGERPDGQDFQYFAFTVGMTYQVSDVTITHRNLRRVVMRHAMLSFAYGTVIIAMTINFIVARI